MRLYTDSIERWLFSFLLINDDVDIEESIVVGKKRRKIAYKDKRLQILQSHPKCQK